MRIQVAKLSPIAVDKI